MIGMGMAVALGLLIVLVKLPWVWRLRILSNPIKVDIAIFIGLFLLHEGTYSGVMVATLGALICSVVLSLGRWLFGHTVNSSYEPGIFNISSKL